MKVKAKTQRLWLVVGAMVALGGAGALAFSTLGDKATYFYAPSDLDGKPLPVAAIRLGGMVEKGSLVKNGQTVTFVVTDNAQTWPVTYTGILPDLFREGSGVVAEGRMEGRTFVADTILAKHDERYMPPQLGNQQAEHRVGKTVVK